MKKYIVVLFLINLIFVSCSQKDGNMDLSNNPLLTEWETPFQTPPFAKIKDAHFLPAFKEGIRLQQQEIESIVTTTEAPTFENTILALEESGEVLTRVGRVFNLISEALTSKKIQSVAQEITPLVAKHKDDINLNDKLFQRIKVVYDKRGQIDLEPEQKTLLEKKYKNFVRGGANLNEEDKSKLRKVNEELSLLTLEFGDNVLAETNSFELIIENETELSGLPDGVKQAAAENAKARGHENSWAFTLDKPSLIPLLQYSDQRELREKMFKAYIMRGDNNNEFDNKAILSKIAKLRVEKANLLGYDSHANFVLEPYMAKEPKTVYNLLNQLWNPALKKAQSEVKDLQTLIDSEGADFQLEAWDWWYYAEKLKKAKYDYDGEVLRPYFKLENVIEGAFKVANKLYGIEFVERKDISVYHEDVKVYEVNEADGKHIGILFTDYFPRPSKRGGAWMSDLRKQFIKDGENITPVVYNVGNFSKPTGDKPSLISVDEALTLFHELGHGLHSLFSKCNYESLAGADVAWDFVELQSTIMENWAMQPEVLKLYAEHYETGEIIPNELLAKMERAGTFNQGFVTVEYLAACFLDMDWHTITDAKEYDVIEFENNSMKKLGLIPEIVVRYRSPYFRHVFSGEYSSGYYSYIWSEVLDADAFEAFKETSLFDQKTAQSFRENILSKGATEEPMILYKKFRGREPKVEPLLKRRGLDKF